MSRSRVYVNELRQREADAWTALLRLSSPLQEITVTDVTVERLKGEALVRYLLTFDGYSDPVPFVGKKTNAIEARFFQDLAPQLPRLLPRCWLSHVARDWSWIVLDDVPDHHPFPKWTSDDVENVVASLASLHASFWQQEDALAAFGWLPAFLGRREQGLPVGTMMEVWRQWDSVPRGRVSVSSHALKQAGRMAPTFVRAAAGLAVLQKLGGWPGIINRRHLDAVAELLDDPLPMLQSLRELPVTLLHQNLAPQHWRVTLFGDQILLDWRNVAIGPAVCDLVNFVEQMELLRTHRVERGAGLDLPVSQETIVDSYLLRMHVELPKFDARATRQAVPAALCLHVLATWLPRFADWFRPFVGSPLTWQALTTMSDHELRRAGYGRLAGLHDYLSNLFSRFWYATRMF